MLGRLGEKSVRLAGAIVKEGHVARFNFWTVGVGSTEGLGGAWIGTGERLTPFRKNLFDHKERGFLSNADNDPVVYKRATVANNAIGINSYPGL